ncbi:hypothetical protein J5N97_022504 [Dioscorea zingiberensis]|uniref:WAT1-related protein n=1 Tax=Dioscorea zingiberensis TaxID=325984 RepID=A0A9D5CBP4_9LILI|nr:hypothetical protein J5N97_022504 [Dioscorea zingiberensis]
MADKRPYVAMVVVQVIVAGMAMISKAAFNMGMNTFIFLFYRQAFSVIFLLPLCLIFGRLTINLDVYNVAIKFTSTTVATAATNAIPVLTFILAVLLKMETLNPRRLPGILKLFGVTLCLVGVLVIAFYKGPQLISLNSVHPIIHGSVANHHMISNSKKTWIKGTFLMVLSAVAWSSWIVSQGLFIGVLAFYLQTWSIDKKGPVFAAIFTPLSLVITIALSALLLGEITYLGSVLGGAVMVIGLYSVLWGKIKEKKPADQILST